MTDEMMSLRALLEKVRMPSGRTRWLGLPRAFDRAGGREPTGSGHGERGPDRSNHRLKDARSP
jgi:hypothetical protein